jgi:hypothetical protein
MDYEAIRESLRRGVENVPDDNEGDLALLLNVIRELKLLRQAIEQGSLG